jgi:hypothetical protein
MISARTAPPRKTMCFRRGGSSIRILKFCIARTQGSVAFQCEIERGDLPGVDLRRRLAPASGRAASSPFLAVMGDRGTCLIRRKVRCVCIARFGCRPLLLGWFGIEVLAEEGLRWRTDVVRTGQLTCHAGLLHIDEVRLHHAFRSLISLRANFNHTPVRQLSRLINTARHSTPRDLQYNSPRAPSSPRTTSYPDPNHNYAPISPVLTPSPQNPPHITKLLLDLPDRLEIRRPFKRVPTHQEQLDQVPGDVSARHIQSAR